NAYIVSDSTLGVGKTVILGSGASTTAVGMQTNSVGSTEIVVGSSTRLLSASTVTLVPPPIVVGSHSIAANGQSQYTIAGHTLAVGSSITIGSGTSTTIVVLQTNSAGATEVLIGSSTSTLLTVPSSINLVTVAGETYMPSIVTGYIHGAQTLYPNGPSITLTPASGASALLAALKTDAAGVTELVVGSTTSFLSPTVTAPLVVAGQTFTPNLQAEYIIAGQTLYPGAAITVSGTPVSLQASATAAVEGTSTEGLGGYIMSGLGGPSSGTLTTPTTPVMATSAASVTKTRPTVAASAATASGTGAVASWGRAERPWGSAWCLGLSVVLLAVSGVLKT
ncbi:hypothetical protein LTR60_001386, partial [Cryomyces antarcticus]